MDYRTHALEKLAALPSIWSVLRYPTTRLFQKKNGPTDVTQTVTYENGQTKKVRNDYITSLLSNEKFAPRLGGKSEAVHLSRTISNTPVYVDRGTEADRISGRTSKTTSTEYNPFTGRIKISPYTSYVGSDKYFYDPENSFQRKRKLLHENFHAMYENSPFYSSTVKDSLAKFNIPYTLRYNPDINDKEGYINQPSEQAAVFNELRSQLGLMPGTGTGPNGTFTQEDLNGALQTKKYDKEMYNLFFGDKPEGYLLHLFNNAKNKKTPSFRHWTTMVS